MKNTDIIYRKHSIEINRKKANKEGESKILFLKIVIMGGPLLLVILLAWFSHDTGTFFFTEEYQDNHTFVAVSMMIILINGLLSWWEILWYKNWYRKMRPVYYRLKQGIKRKFFNFYRR